MSVCGRVASRGSHGSDNGEAGAGEQPPPGAFPKSFIRGFMEDFTGVRRLYGFPPAAAKRQLFSSALIRLSNSSNEVSPLIFSPLRKKVGVESTFSTSEAYFWSAAILSSNTWSLRQDSTCCWLNPACFPI